MDRNRKLWTHALVIGLCLNTTAAFADRLAAVTTTATARTGTSADQKTIIGGFKTMTGMDSEAEVMTGPASLLAYGPGDPDPDFDDFAIEEDPEPPVWGPTVVTGWNPPEPPTGPAVFESVDTGSVAVDWMGAWIDTALHDQVVGYAYVINQDGEIAHSNAVGAARTAQDGGLSMSIHTRNTIASVTKQITAIATIKALHEAGLTIDTPIGDYLPSEWGLGFGIWGSNGLTFRDLMRHETGWGQFFDQLEANEDETALGAWGNDWDGLEWIVSNGAMPGAGYSYKNANYALLRVLIPRLWIEAGGAPYAEITEGNHSLMYLAYIQQHIFEPAGIDSVGCWMQPNFEEALSYSKDFVETGGTAHSYPIANCGGHAGLRLSAHDLAKYLAYLRHSDEILHYTQLGLANQHELGWTPGGGEGNHWKGGDYFSTFVMPATNPVGGVSYATSSEVEFRKGSHACVMIFPYGYEASIVINSEYATGFEGSACGVLKDAFEFAVSN